MNYFWDDAKERLDNISKRRAALLGKKAAIMAERDKTLKQTKQSQERIELGDVVREVLERLQKKEQERAVGAYEELLGALLSDVLPGERNVVMDLHTERGGPALDVYIQKGQNAPLEDWLGTGGSVTNLLSTGLRLVALLRSGQRRFLILDESDCWLKPELIPKYASIVKQMAIELDIQILMISHHDESLFSAHIPHRLKLEKSGSVLTSSWSPSSQIPTWIDGERGIRSLTLKNFQAHQNTVIPLSSKVTLLQGDNDIGKSSIVNAIRAVFDGDVNDTAIKHYAPSAKVMIDFGPDNLLIWERWRKGKVKTNYQLINPENGETIHHNDGTKVPEWVKDGLKIGKVDGLDIQIGQQKDPVFLLNQPPSFRARALAIGQESSYINNMLGHDKQEVNDARAQFKEGERNLERLRRHLIVFDKMDALKIDGGLKESIENGALLSERIEGGKDLLRQWEKWQKVIVSTDKKLKTIHLPKTSSHDIFSFLFSWQRIKTKCKALGYVDKLENVYMPKRQCLEIKKLINKWKKSFKEHQILEKIENQNNGENMDKQISRIKSYHEEILSSEKTLHTWKRSSDIIDALGLIEDLKSINNKEIKNTNVKKVREVLNSWEEKRINLTDSKDKLDKIKKEYDKLIGDIKHIKPTCPTCHQELNIENIERTLAKH